MTNETNTNETTWLWPYPFAREASRGYYTNIEPLHTGVDFITSNAYGMPVVASK